MSLPFTLLLLVLGGRVHKYCESETSAEKIRLVTEYKFKRTILFYLCNNPWLQHTLYLTLNTRYSPTCGIPFFVILSSATAELVNIGKPCNIGISKQDGSDRYNKQ